MHTIKWISWKFTMTTCKHTNNVESIGVSVKNWTMVSVFIHLTHLEYFKDSAWVKSHQPLASHSYAMHHPGRLFCHSVIIKCGDLTYKWKAAVIINGF